MALFQKRHLWLGFFYYDRNFLFPQGIQAKERHLFLVSVVTACCLFPSQGVQSQERHLFLFSDLLLVAKSRSGGNFKLKEKVRVSEMWLSSCLEEVAEVAKSHETSFVMGWPTTNVVATFR